MAFKVKFELKGAHIHCDLFAAPFPNSTWAGCGSFCVREEEFTALQLAMGGVFFEAKGRKNAEAKGHLDHIG